MIHDSGKAPLDYAFLHNVSSFFSKRRQLACFVIFSPQRHKEHRDGTNTGEFFSVLPLCPLSLCGDISIFKNFHHGPHGIHGKTITAQRFFVRVFRVFCGAIKKSERPLIEIVPVLPCACQSPAPHNRPGVVYAEDEMFTVRVVNCGMPQQPGRVCVGAKL